jgi:hypothetical protein
MTYSPFAHDMACIIKLHWMLHSRGKLSSMTCITSARAFFREADGTCVQRKVMIAHDELVDKGTRFMARIRCACFDCSPKRSSRPDGRTL